MAKFDPTEYSPGDVIRIFDHRQWSPDSFSTGKVVKVTPSGRVVVEQSGNERRFKANGKEFGGSEWRRPWVESKAAAEVRIADLRVQKRKQETRTELDALRGLDPNSAELIERLRALADKLATPA